MSTSILRAITIVFKLYCLIVGVVSSDNNTNQRASILRNIRNRINDAIENWNSSLSMPTMIGYELLMPRLFTKKKLLSEGTHDISLDMTDCHGYIGILICL